MDADDIYLVLVVVLLEGAVGVRSEDDGKRSVRHNNQISGVLTMMYVSVSNVSEVS
jgi:hypothetical protein